MIEHGTSGPVIALHVYGYKEDCRTVERQSALPIESRPAVTTRLGIAAARQLIERGEAAQTFIVSGKNMLGESEPVSSVTTREIRRFMPDAIIYENPTGQVSTREELRFAHDVAHQQGFQDVISIGWGIHRPRIKRIGKVVFKPSIVDRLLKKKHAVSAVWRGTEEILATYPDQHNARRYQGIIDKVHASPAEERWKKYESKAMLATRIPYGAEVLDMMSRVWRPRAD